MRASRHKSAHEGTILRDKFTTEDIFERIIQVADEEVTTRFRELFFSALAAGFAITLTFFLYASLTSKSGGNPFLGALLYPLGFMYIVLGGYQLFTENTLPPVALVMERMASIPAVLRVWFIVLFGNLLGGLIGALILASTGLFSSSASMAAVEIANATMTAAWFDLLFRGVFAGLIVAGVVWLDYAMREGSARFFLVYIAFLAIPLGNLNHVVITGTEAFYLFFKQGGSLVTMLYDAVLPVFLGNAIGGVVLVTVVNYFQTPKSIRDDDSKRLPLRKWLFSFSTYRNIKK